MKNIFSRFAKNESGATAIEYGLIAALIAVGLVATLGFVGDDLVSLFAKVSTDLEGATTP